MKELITRIVTNNGLTPEQADRCLLAVRDWLDENFPVAGTLTASWMQRSMELDTPTDKM